LQDRVIVLHALRPPAWPEPDRRELLERLPYAKRLDLERRSAADCTASLAALRLLERGLELLQGQGDAPWPRLEFPFERKPVLAGGPSFSLSHSATRVACAIASTGEVGLDVEEPRAGRTAAALRDWTAREATLKASGVGLRGWRDVVFEQDGAHFDGRRYWLRALDLGGDSIAALAWTQPITALRVCLIADPA
jgi:phosphopantetheinyl transferase